MPPIAAAAPTAPMAFIPVESPDILVLSISATPPASFAIFANLARLVTTLLIFVAVVASTFVAL